MISFFWRFPIARMESSRFFPEEFVLLPEEAKISPNALCGGEVWLIADAGRDGDFLFGRFVATGFSVVDEGIDAGRYLIQVNPFQSFRILPHEEVQRRKWKLDGAPLSSGVSLCTHSQRSDFVRLLHSAVPKSLSPPHPTKTSGIKLPSGDFSPREKGREFFRLTLSGCAFGDLESWERYRGASPFAALAVAKCGELDTPEPAVREILRLDSELTGTLSPETVLVPSITGESPTAAGPPRVDTLLIQIQAGDILTRQYRDGEQSVAFSAEKTQAAEDRHQEILRDIVEFTREQGFLPLSSRSVDLTFMLDKGLLLIEVKSANGENFLSQVGKGIVQITKYELAFEDERSLVSDKLLVVEPINETREMDLAKRLGARLGVAVGFYQRDLPWPERLEKLMEFLYRKNG